MNSEFSPRIFSIHGSLVPKRFSCFLLSVYVTITINSNFGLLGGSHWKLCNCQWEPIVNIRPPDKSCVLVNNFLYFSSKTYVVGTHKTHLNETVPEGPG